MEFGLPNQKRSGGSFAFFENKDYFCPKSRAMFSATLVLVFILYKAFMVQVLRARETRATEMPHATQFEHCKPRPIIMR